MVGLGRGKQDPVDAGAEEPAQQASPAEPERGEDRVERQTVIGKSLLAGVQRTQHVDEHDLPVHVTRELCEEGLHDNAPVRLETRFHQRGETAGRGPCSDRQRHRAKLQQRRIGDLPGV